MYMRLGVWNARSFYRAHVLKRSRDLREKLTVTQLVKKFSSFYETWMFNSVFTEDRHLFLSWSRLIEFTPSHRISRRSFIILPSHLRLGLPSGSSPQILQTNTICIFHPSHACYIPRPSHPPWLDHPNNILWSVQVMKLLIMKSSPVSTIQIWRVTENKMNKHLRTDEKGWFSSLGR